ncbi:MAG: hypothetical protein GOU99_00395 [Candidatus Altiarchaeota archaeon]|nr:hypothetical protein [Candidatus Altiarchaeota archaeon]
MDKSIETRLKARNQLTQFFDIKRQALQAGGIMDFSFKNQTKRRLLKEMNGIAREFELRAMKLAEQGKDPAELMGKAEKAIENLKKLVVQEIRSRPMGDEVHKELIDEISSI